MITFDSYIDNSKPEQKDIYYLGGDNKDVMMTSPLVTGLVRRNLDVLLMDDPIDEYVI